MRKMLAALQDRTQHRLTTDSALRKWIVRHAALLNPRFRRNHAQSPFKRAMGGPYRGMLQEFGEAVLAHLPGVRKGSGNPAPKLADRWKSAVCLGKSDLTDEHLVRTDEGVVYARRVRRIAEHSWPEENLRAVVETPQTPKSPTLDIPPAADPLAPPPAEPEVHGDEKEQPTQNPAGDDEMQGEPPDTPMTPGASTSNRGEKRTETKEATSMKKRLTTKTSTEKRPATFADEFVKRRLTGEQRHERRRAHASATCAHASGDRGFVSLEHCEHTFQRQDWCGNESRQAKILSNLGDPKEVKSVQQVELNSPREMGAMTAVNRSSEAGKRVMQTRWVDRETDGCVKSRLVMEDFNRDQGHAQPEMFAPVPSTLSLKKIGSEHA